MTLSFHCKFRVDVSKSINALLLVEHQNYSVPVVIKISGKKSRMNMNLFLCSISIWHTTTGNELLRITVANKTCNSVCFTRDGKKIIR